MKQHTACTSPLHDTIPDWKAYLQLSSDEELRALKRNEHTGSPLGSDRFVKQIEQSLERILQPQEPGPKNKRVRYYAPELVKEKTTSSLFVVLTVDMPRHSV